MDWFAWADEKKSAVVMVTEMIIQVSESVKLEFLIKMMEF